MRGNLQIALGWEWLVVLAGRLKAPAKPFIEKAADSLPPSLLQTWCSAVWRVLLGGRSPSHPLTHDQSCAQLPAGQLTSSVSTPAHCFLN